MKKLIKYLEREIKDMQAAQEHMEIQKFHTHARMCRWKIEVLSCLLDMAKDGIFDDKI